MSSEPIVIEQLFSVPPDVVWQAVTRPNLMREWYFEQIEDFRPEVGFETGFDIEVNGRIFGHQWKVIEVVPGTSITYTWRYRGYPGLGTTEWKLSKTETGTNLVLTSSGIESFSQDIPEFTRESGEAGWEYFIQQRLADFLAGAVEKTEQSEPERKKLSRLHHDQCRRTKANSRRERCKEKHMISIARKQQIQDLLKSIETGDSAAVAVVNPTTYIQHNPETHEGGEGLAALFKRLSKTNPHVNIVRIFEDGDYVFAHTEYDFATSKIGFEVFRFSDDLVVEHWDNLQPKSSEPNPSGHTMTDGPTQSTDFEKTQENKELVRTFVDDILVNGRMDKLHAYFDGDTYIQHNPQIGDGLSGLGAALEEWAKQGIVMKYDRIHRILGEGNFVLVVSEGNLAGNHSSFYDLFRVADGKIAEHWDTIETIPPRDQWKNENGKF